MPVVKCLSLWQPWASAVALGAKRIETRSWSTRYRGPLAIHAAKRPLTKQERFDFTFDTSWRSALNLGTPARGSWWEELPYGALIATCELVDCRPTESFSLDVLHTSEIRRTELRALGIFAWSEHEMGDFSAGRYGWVLEDVRALPEPLPCRGLQGLFNVEL